MTRDSRNLLIELELSSKHFYTFGTVDALDDVGEQVDPVVGHDLRVGVCVEVEQAVEVVGALCQEDFLCQVHKRMNFYPVSGLVKRPYSQVSKLIN